MKKICLTAIFSTLCLLCLYLSGCNNPVSQHHTDASAAQRETLTQISTIDAILCGVYDGTIEFGTLRNYGDFGIGTFDRLDGEMLGFDGNFYQVKSDGLAYPVSASMKTPFASVTFFDTDLSQAVPTGIHYDQLQDFLNSILPTDNIFYAIKIEGTFSFMKTRSVPAQEKPYPPLAEVTPKQPIFEFSDVEGTIVGFKCPAYVSGVNVPGYHLHFINEERNAGGHVLEFHLKTGRLSVEHTSSFHMELPHNGSPADTGFTPEQQKDIKRVEE
jgi:acetolactate decarboxylase